MVLQEVCILKLHDASMYQRIFKIFLAIKINRSFKEKLHQQHIQTAHPPVQVEQFFGL